MGLTNGEIIIKSTWSQNYGLKFVWNANQNIVNNSDDFKVDMYAYFESNGTINVGSRSDAYITINGVRKEIRTPAVYKMDKNIKSIYLGTAILENIKHKDDGTLDNVVISGYWPIRAKISDVYRNDISASFGTGEITKIPRASQVISSPTFTLENDFNIKLKRYSDLFKHTIDIYLDNHLEKSYSDIETEVTVQFTSNEITALYQRFNNTNEIDTKIVVKTFNGNDLIGNTEVFGKMLIDETLNRAEFNSFSWLCDDLTKQLTNWNEPIQEDNGRIIFGYTTLTINCNDAIAKNSATIIGYEAVINNKTYKSNTTQIQINEPIEYADVLKVCTVDSRGFKTTISKQISGITYKKPSPINVIAERKEYPNNTNVLINLEILITKNENLNNTATVKYLYRKKENNSQWSEEAILESNLNQNGLLVVNKELNGFDLKSNYDIKIIIIDKLGTYEINEIIFEDKPFIFEGYDGSYEINGYPVLYFAESIEIELEE